MKKYKFTETWFDDVARETWGPLFNKFTNIHNVMEIGAFEGKATTWLCDNVNSIKKYHIVDIFINSKMINNQKHDIYVKENFLHNISYHKDTVDFVINEGYSQKILPTYPDEFNEFFDFIYIDGSHKSDETFIDAYYVNKFLKKGGLLIFDDYGWKDHTDLSLNNSPELGIKMFFTLYPNYTPIMQGYQIGAIKN